MAALEQQKQLSDLVRTRRTQLGGARPLSYRDLAERSVDPETGEKPFSHAWLNKLEHGRDMLTPKLPEMRALAAGLQVPLSVVQSAAASQFMGIEGPEIWSEDHSVRVVVARMGELSEEDRAAFAQMAEAYARSRKSDT